MATAAKSIGVGPIGVETGPIPVPGAAEMFAAMVAGATGEETPGDGATPDAANDEVVESPEAQIDASILLPMLDQQRAASPAAKLVSAPVDTPSPATARIADMVADSANSAPLPGGCAVQPVPTDGVSEAAVPVAPAAGAVTDPAPVMRPLPDGKPATPPAKEGIPVMRPLVDGKSPPAAVTDKRPVLRPVDPDKPATVTVTDPAPVMRPLDASKPATATIADPAPVMRPIAGDAPKAGTAQPAVQPATGDAPVATAGAQPLDVKIASPASAPAPGPTAPLLAAVAPAPASAKPQPNAKSTDAKATAPEVQLAAAEAQAAPVAAKARTSRAPSAPVTVDAPQESTATTPVATAATETRNAVQPLHAAPALVQPLAAPVAAPVQNVAAALSQQVLDMSGGDAWIDQIARDISRTAGKDGAMRFRLAPETLGELKIEITQSERGAHVRMHVTSEAAQQALAAAEHKLGAEARAQGVRIAETEISFTNGQSQGRDLGRSAHEQAGAQAQANSQSHNGQSARQQRSGSAASFNDAAAPSGRRTDRYA